MLFHNMELDSNIWGPKYWFFLHTISLTYPLHPNDVIKKKYYDFIQNFPLFIPNHNMSNEFIKLLDRYPVSPYLDSRDSFIKWIHFIHNKINSILHKPHISMDKFLQSYYEEYKPKEIKSIYDKRLYNKYIFIIIFFIILCFSIYLYHK